MPLAFNNLDNGTVANYTVTTGIITPTITPVFVAVSQAKNVAPPTPATVSGCGLVWTEIDNVAYGSRRTITVLRGDGIPIADNITITGQNGTQLGLCYAIFEISDINSLGVANTDSNTGSNANTILAGSPVAGDWSIGFVGFEDDINPTWEASFTEVYDLSEPGNVRRFTVGYSTSADSTPNCSFAVSSGWGIVGFYIFAVAGTPVIALKSRVNVISGVSL